MKKHCFWSVLILFLIPSVVRAVIEVDSSGNPIGSQSSVAGESFRSHRDLKSKNRVGVGFRAGGASGPYAVGIDLNLTNDLTFGLAGGASTQMSTFHVFLRNTIGGQRIAPYYSLGYARWTSVGDRLSPRGLEPAFLREDLIRPEQVQVGNFAFDFLTPSVGVLLHQLSGSWSGMALGIEGTLLVNFQRLSSHPVASGQIYYFF